MFEGKVWQPEWCMAESGSEGVCGDFLNVWQYEREDYGSVYGKTFLIALAMQHSSPFRRNDDPKRYGTNETYSVQFLSSWNKTLFRSRKHNTLRRSQVLTMKTF